VVEPIRFDGVTMSHATIMVAEGSTLEEDGSLKSPEGETITGVSVNEAGKVIDDKG
jgi:hypothetical protein